MKIGLYFGSFNPIHIGHCIIANHILNEAALNQVWFVVSPQNPFKVSNGLLNEYQRLHLVKLAIESAVKLRASDIEFSLPKPSYTIDTLAHLQERFSSHEFSIVMGSDSFENLPRWKKGHLIEAQFDIYVYHRPNHPISRTPGKRVKFLDAPLLEISSTRIRQDIKSKKSIRFLVPDAVLEEIEKNGYYK
jgi:nicotinate-nucleotide adenylyltransferase